MGYKYDRLRLAFNFWKQKLYQGWFFSNLARFNIFFILSKSHQLLFPCHLLLSYLLFVIIPKVISFPWLNYWLRYFVHNFLISKQIRSSFLFNILFLVLYNCILVSWQHFFSPNDKLIDSIKAVFIWDCDNIYVFQNADFWWSLCDRCQFFNIKIYLIIHSVLTHQRLNSFTSLLIIRVLNIKKFLIFWVWFYPNVNTQVFQIKLTSKCFNIIIHSFHHHLCYLKLW